MTSPPSKRVKRVFGPPGTGKTTFLLDRVEEYLQAGVPPDRIGFMAFTRKAAHEAIDRASAKFGLSEDDLPWFRTLHSAAFKILGLSPDEVMQRSHYEELSAELGGVFVFKERYDHETERPVLKQKLALGDEALFFATLAKAKQCSLEQSMHQPYYIPRILPEELERFNTELENYKASEHLLDFSDFLDEVHSPLGLDVLIIDEAQDLTPQQWAFAQRVGADAKEVIIAGDDDQAIYEWAGASNQRFLEFDAEEIVLPKSYRLTRATFDVVSDVASRIQHRHEKIWHPREEDGWNEHYRLLEQVRVRDFEGDWLMLARTNYYAQALVERCRELGVVYKHRGIWSNEHKPVRAVLFYEKLRSGAEINYEQAKKIVDYVPGLSIELDRKPREKVGWDEIDWPFEGKPEWFRALSRLPEPESAYIRRVKYEGESLVKPGNVVISTIHASKGGEADNVLILPDISGRVRHTMFADPDQEHRVWYVAASRARKTLHLVRGKHPKRQYEW